MQRRAVVLVLTVVLAPLGARAVQGQPKPAPAAGTPVALGPYQAQLAVWETGIEIEVHDERGKLVPPREVSGKATVQRINGEPSLQSGAFTPREMHLWAKINLAGARELQLTLVMQVRGRPYTATVVWRLDEDPARRNDGLQL